VVKKLRYYARYIVVCLLLNRRALVVELVDELQTLVDEYVRDFKPADAAAWRLVLQEINLFLQAPTRPPTRSLDSPGATTRANACLVLRVCACAALGCRWTARWRSRTGPRRRPRCPIG
jgi:hypothetical protein